MKFKFFCLFFVFIAAILGMKMGGEKVASQETSSSETEFPLLEYKSFAVVIYAHNQADWCERALRSVMSQDYEHFRVFFIDDASSDETAQKAESLVVENNQQNRVFLVRNPSHLGESVALHQVIHSLLDKEIVVPLQAKDWFAHPNVLNVLNRAYQNPDTWLTFSSSIVYPTYEIKKDSEVENYLSFYSALFKKIYLSDLMQEEGARAYLTALKILAGSHVHKAKDLSFFENIARPSRASSEKNENCSFAHYSPLAQFPKTAPLKEKADILIFSCDRPLQLYACLESIHHYMSGFETVSVLYRSSQEKFAAGYKKVKAAFPSVRFISQSSNYKKDFKPLLMEAVFSSPSKYILFGVDDIVVKDFTDIKDCMNWMEKTNAYGFYLRFGKHISYCYQIGKEQPVPSSVPLGGQVYAWSLDQGVADWGFPNSLDMTLYRKEDLKKSFKELKFNTPNSLEFCWANQCRPKEAIGLYFESSKIVNIPFNVVSRTGNPHMNYSSPEELLAKFEEGLKMDIRPLYKIENSSPHFEYLPEFIPW